MGARVEGRQGVEDARVEKDLVRRTVAIFSGENEAEAVELNINAIAKVGFCG